MFSILLLLGVFFQQRLCQNFDQPKNNYQESLCASLHNNNNNNNCLKCLLEEENEPFCLETGYKSLTSCEYEKDGKPILIYQSCTLLSTSSSSSTSMPTLKVSSYAVSPVITFQILMAIFGGLAYWGVQTHRESSMTQFDTRRQRQRYSRIQTV